MSIWTKRIEIQSRVGRLLVSSIVICLVQVSAITLLVQGRGFHLSGWASFLTLAIVFAACFIAPMFAALFVSRGLRPEEGRPTGWQHVALAIASVVGGIATSLFSFFVLGPIFPNPGTVVLALSIWFGQSVAAVAFGLWILGLLRPNGPWPRWPTRRRRRMRRGECEQCGYCLKGCVAGVCPECGTPYSEGRCLYCGYDLTGNVSGACPECGTAVDTSEHGAKPAT